MLTFNFIARGTSKHKLLFETAKTFKWELLAPVFPRLVLIVFTMCQPLLLNRFVNYLSEPKGPENTNIGYGLIAAYGFVYLGLAVSCQFKFKNLMLIRIP
jgi:ATP-binding cassette subfamily C (CFTR/MRP) protein 1